MFHNLPEYNSHFIIKSLAIKIAGILQLLLKTYFIHKYINCTNLQFHFTNSCRFMFSSLDRLISCLDLLFRTQLPQSTKGLFRS